MTKKKLAKKKAGKVGAVDQAEVINQLAAKLEIALSANEQLQKSNATLRDEIDKIRSPGVIIKAPGAMDVMVEKVGVDGMAEFDDNGTLLRPDAEIDPGPVSPSKMEMLAFMNEFVVIHILEDSNENAAESFMIGVNGRKFVFTRNRLYRVRRYVVEGLARAKPISYGNEEYVRSDGVRDVRWPTRTGLRYGFAVQEDRNPKGAEWLRKILREP